MLKKKLFTLLTACLGTFNTFNTFSITLSAALSSYCVADVLVIVNADNAVDTLEQKKVVDLFMGRVTAFPSDKPAVTLDLGLGSSVRASFYKALTGKSEAQVDAYWATLVFAGRMSRPRQFENEQSLIETVADNQAAAAYVFEQPLPDSVKVVLTLPTNE